MGMAPRRTDVAATNRPHAPAQCSDQINTPLAWVTRRGHREIVELLKQQGAQ
jgi:hypothetical protein